jgi:hypothetical protein
MAVGDASIAGVENGLLVLSFLVASRREMTNGNVRRERERKVK